MKGRKFQRDSLFRSLSYLPFFVEFFILHGLDYMSFPTLHNLVHIVVPWLFYLREILIILLRLLET